MKIHHTAAIVILALSHAAIAHPRPPGPLKMISAAPPEDAAPKPQLAVIEEELGSARDKFETYRKLTFEGFRYYVKDEEARRLLHAEIYRKIRDNTLNERLTVSEARGFVAELLEAGRENAALRQNNGAAPEEGESASAENLDELSKKVDLAMVEKIDGGILTPDLNRREWLMDELVHFGADTSIAQTKLTALVSRLDLLLTAEERAKQNGELTDNVRNRLLDSSVDAWKIFVRTFDR